VATDQTDAQRYRRAARLPLTHVEIGAA